MTNQTPSITGTDEFPTEEMCDAAREFLMGMEVGIKDYAKMIVHFQNLGTPIPKWMECRTGHLTKWDKADCIWRLMAVALPAKPTPVQSDEELVEVVARVLAIRAYHDNGLETMGYKGEEDFADREWWPYKYDAKAAIQAIREYDRKGK